MARTNTAIALVHPVIEGETVNETPREKTFDERRAELNKFFHAVGRKLAAAQITKTEAAYAFRDACRDGLASVAAKGSDDAEKCYLAIANAHNAALAGRKDVDLLPCDAKSAKSAISVFRSFGRRAVVLQGDDWFSRVSRVRDYLAVSGACKLSAYMAMYRANNAVAAQQAKQIGNRPYYATDEDIADWIANKPAARDTASEAMDKFLKSMTQMSQDYAFGSDVEAAMELLFKAGAQFISDQTQLGSM